MPFIRTGVWSAALVTAASLAGTGAAGVGAPQVSAVRATLSIGSQPRALAVFVGSLSGGRLNWRLTYHGLGPALPSASLRAGGKVVRLCGPCATGASGRTALGTRLLAAVKARAATIALTSSTATIAGKLQLGTVPTLQLAGLADGASLHLPAVVHYTVTGFKVGPGAGMIAAYDGTTEIALQPGPDAGSVTLPDDKRLTGRRDLTFVLEDATGTRLANREAVVRVYNVVLAGRR